MSALLHWLNTYGSPTEAAHTLSDLKSGTTLYNAFSCGQPADNDTSNVSKDKLQEVANHFSCPCESDDDLLQLATAVLVYLVQSEEGKEECVQNIMELAEDDQEELMNVIQLHLSTLEESPASPSNDSDTPNTPASTLAHSPFVSSPCSTTSSPYNDGIASTTSTRLSQLHASVERVRRRRRSSIGGASVSGGDSTTPGSVASSVGGGIPSRRLARENHHLKEEVEFLTCELQKHKSLASEAEMQHRSSFEKLQSDQTRVALQVAEEADALRSSFESSALEKDQQLQELRDQIQNNGEMEVQLVKLKDELVIATESLKEKAKLEDTLNRYREKHAQVGDLNGQVLSLEEKTKELLSRATIAEDKASTIPELKSKLEQYKVAVAAAEVRVSELMMSNKAKDVSIHQMRQKFDELREDNDLRQEERMDMAMQLSVASEDHVSGLLSGHDQEHSTLSSFGGMTELNPEFLERVKFLEKENETLREACDDTTLSKVDELKNNLDDTMRVKEQFETKYHNSCTENRTLAHSLAVTRQHMTSVEKQLEEARAELETTQLQLSETESDLTLTTTTLEKKTKLFEEQEQNLLNQITTLENVQTSMQEEVVVREREYAALVMVRENQSRAELEDLRSMFVEHTSKHSLSDVHYQEMLKSMEEESRERSDMEKEKREKLKGELNETTEQLEKMKTIVIKGKSKLEQKETLLSKQIMKMKQGATLLKKFKTDNKQLKSELENSKNDQLTLKQKVKLTKNENALLRDNGCSDMESGDPSSRRSASKLASELDRVIGENKQLQKEIDGLNRQLTEKSSLIVGRAGRRSTRSSGGSSAKTSAGGGDVEASSATALLESENMKLRKENKTLSMMKTVYTRKEHQSELKEQQMLREKKELENIITHLRLQMERRAPTLLSDKDHSSNSSSSSSSSNSSSSSSQEEDEEEEDGIKNGGDEEESAAAAAPSSSLMAERMLTTDQEDKTGKENSTLESSTGGGIRAAAKKTRKTRRSTSINNAEPTEEEAANECNTQ